MNDGLSGVAATLARQLSGTASRGSRRSVSGAEALETTACVARMVCPPRSRTPGQGGREAEGGCKPVRKPRRKPKTASTNAC